MLWFYLRIYPGISHRMEQNQSMFCEWQNGNKLISVSSFEWSQYTIGRYLSHCINFLAVNSKVLWTISCPFEVLRDTRQNSEFLARLKDLKNFQFFLLYLRFQLENVVKNSLQNYFTFENSKFF